MARGRGERGSRLQSVPVGQPRTNSQRAPSYTRARVHVARTTRHHFPSVFLLSSRAGNGTREEKRKKEGGERRGRKRGPDDKVGASFVAVFSSLARVTRVNGGKGRREKKEERTLLPGERTSPRNKRGAILLFFLSLPACEQFSFPSGDKVPFDSFPRICLISPTPSRVL